MGEVADQIATTWLKDADSDTAASLKAANFVKSVPMVSEDARPLELQALRDKITELETINQNSEANRLTELQTWTDKLASLQTDTENTLSDKAIELEKISKESAPQIESELKFRKSELHWSSKLELIQTEADNAKKQADGEWAMKIDALQERHGVLEDYVASVQAYLGTIESGPLKIGCSVRIISGAERWRLAVVEKIECDDSDVEGDDDVVTVSLVDDGWEMQFERSLLLRIKSAEIEVDGEIVEEEEVDGATVAAECENAQQSDGPVIDLLGIISASTPKAAGDEVCPFPNIIVGKLVIYIETSSCEG